ncbi:unnamed protein product [Adineta ricciae]|uniref:NAD(P)(+)--arginine ADP-ribosyltransferase n=1 Tax=Adineta ricciae TaxID=249248 RepID=A0A815K0Y5_ADIRI|nr:unnamed protein product [Adineta ricciae]CAF1384971.1 unnamed protein product [Adineta ricciae]
MNPFDAQTHAARLSDMVEEPGRILLPIEGYEIMPLVSLKESVQPLKSLIPNIEQLIRVANSNVKTTLDSLSPDESAAIVLYSMPCSPIEDAFYFILNKTLRMKNRDALRPWFLYLKLLITALSKLPSKRRVVHRGVTRDLSADYHQGETIVWWGFSSCTSCLKVLQNQIFLGETGKRTLFTIDCHSAKDVQQHSMIAKESEILLLPARQFKVIAIMDVGNDLHIIHLEEVDPPSPLLALLPMGGVLPNSIPYCNDQLEQIIRNCQSRQMDLSGQQLSDQDMRIVVKQGIVGKQCATLDLMKSDLTLGAITILKNVMRKKTFLEVLNISYCAIADSGACLLASVVNSSNLKRLDLEANDISDSGVEHLAKALETNTTLLDLSLKLNRISSQGVNKLTKALVGDSTCLEILNLGANVDVNDESVDSIVALIERNRSLKKLDLRHCSLSTLGNDKLRPIAKARKGFILWLSR